ncbi:DNA polymerase III subunit delta [Flagellimonas sp. S174]|uniref:DNA polymerase III subunit delta n=1 Tax=Flagellimonas sp. S174 TaxID=3410790 RepID=UPI003BF59A99
MDRIKEIVAEIDNKTPKPLYFLMGDEPYYIDKISQYISNNTLSEDEKGFNQMVLYGKETNIEEIVANAKRFPMMADRQVVIVKEAQHLSRTIENLVRYAENPQPSTVLVFCYKYKKLDKRKKLYKAIQKNGELYESKKLYENQVGEWIRRTLSGKMYSISPKASALLVEFLGTDLSKINNELSKLMTIIPKTMEITPDIIEEHIGFSKDFNNFELKKAVGEKNIEKASRIIDYFSNNQKENPFVVTIATLNNFFIQLLQYHGLTDRSPNTVSKTLGVNPYFVNEYAIAAKNYPMKRVSLIISGLRELDLKSKGVGAQNMGQADLLKELLIKFT